MPSLCCQKVSNRCNSKAFVEGLFDDHNDKEPQLDDDDNTHKKKNLKTSMPFGITTTLLGQTVDSVVPEHGYSTAHFTKHYDIKRVFLNFIEIFKLQHASSQTS